jgi:hypothetical protein
MKKMLPVAILLSSLAMPAFAEQYTGMVSILEVWSNGNVAFTLITSPAMSRCNNQFILNKTDDGTKNQLAVLLAAKRTGTPVAVYTDGPCIAAYNYGGSYNFAQFLYAMD